MEMMEVICSFGKVSFPNWEELSQSRKLNGSILITTWLMKIDHISLISTHTHIPFLFKKILLLRIISGSQQCSEEGTSPVL
jgi:hypothetical protein